jgi:nitrogen regulatory protein PII-like uncharacterized protein
MKKIIPILIVAVVAVGGVAGFQLTKSKNASPTTSNKTTANQEVLPVKANPIQNTSEAAGLVITSVAAEDNADPVTNKPIADRLQITLKNTSTKQMSNLEIYYEMKDVKTGQQEAYYQALTGLQLAANESKTIYFDNESGAGHYPENKYSLYRSSQNEVDFTIQVSAPGFKIAPATTKKSAGTGETAG